MKIVESVSRPSIAFWLALAVLLPISLSSVMRDSWFSQPPKPVGDGLDYDNIAFHLSIGRGFYLDNRNPQWLSAYQSQPAVYRLHLDAEPRDLPTTGRPPLYPTILAGLYVVFGRDELGFRAARIFSAVCLALAGALAVSLTAKVIRSFSEPRSSLWHPWATTCALLVALGLAANNRTLSSYANDFLTEPLALLLTQLFVSLVVYHSLRTEQSKQALLRTGVEAGILLGAMILTRSIFVVWLPGIWILLATGCRGTLRQRGLMACVVILVAGLTCLPWWVRNVIVLERFMPLGTQGPITMLGGYSDASLAASGDWRIEPELELRRRLQSDPDFVAANSNTAREIIVAQVANQEVRHWIFSRISALPKLLVARVITHWNPYYGRSLGWKVCILLGVIVLIRRRHASAPILVGMPLLSTVVVALLYTTGGRFLVPLYGVLYCLAGLGVYAAMSGLGKRGASRPQVHGLAL